jgi:aminopeptidase YwaD
MYRRLSCGGHPFFALPLPPGAIVIEPGRDAALSALAATRRILGQFQFRIAGTEECREASRAVSEHLVLHCTKVREESFTLHPRALWWLGRVMAVIAVAAAALPFIAGPAGAYAAAALTLLGIVYGVSQYVFYGTLFDGLFRSAVGVNVAGRIDPVGEVERQVVVVAHHDSPYIFSFLERFPWIAFPRFILAMAGYLGVAACSLIMAVRVAADLGVPAPAVPWISCGCALVAAQLFVMMSSRRSPGAGDNLNSSSMLAEVAAVFDPRGPEASRLSHTRLFLVSTDGEEIGQRGAIAFVKKHITELRALPTFVLNIDSVYFRKDLAVLTRDRNGTCGLSRAMVDDLCAIAAAQGVKLRRMPIPFGGGGTDAAAFAVAGIPATSIIAQPTGMFSRDHIYHTSKDVADSIEVEVVEAVLRLAAAYVRKVDCDGRR